MAAKEPAKTAGPKPAGPMAEIAGLAKSGRALLLVGAGATKDGKGARWDELAKELATKAGTPVRSHPQETMDFACSNQMRRATGYAYVQDRLRGVTAPAPLQQVLSHPWPLVLTTNYDTAIEDFYRSGGKVRPRVFLGLEPVLQLGIPGLMPVLKLSGCLTVDAGKPGEMVLTSTDRERHHDRTGYLYRHLEEIVQVQALVTIGYSYRDDILVHVVKRVRGLHANANIRIYAVFPSDEMPQGADLETLELHDIVPVAASVQELGDALASNAGLDAVEFVRVQQGSGILHVPGRRLKETAEAMEVVTEQMFTTDVSLQEFLEGKTRAYSPHVLGRAWKRPELAGTMGHVKEWLESGSRALFLNVSGNPGSGRTSLSFAVAAELIGKHDFVGLRSRPGSARLSVNAAKQFVAAAAETRKAKRVPLVVQCDELTSAYEVLYFLRDLAAEDNKVVVVRTSTVEVDAVKMASDDVVVGSVPLRDHAVRPDALAAYIAQLPPNLGAPQWRREEIARVLEAAPSFIDAMYTFVNPYRKSLGEIIQERIAKLDGPLREILEGVALPTLAAGEVPISVLARTYEPDYGRLFALLDKHHGLLQVTGTEDAPRGVCLYHQRVASSLMAGHAYRRSALKQFQRILAESQLQTGEGHEMAARVLVRREGAPSVLEETYGPAEVESTWTLLEARPLSKLLLHHMGITWRRMEQLPRAVAILTKAVNLDEGFFGTDRQEIVETSLVHAKWQMLSQEKVPDNLEMTEVQELRARLGEMRSRGRWNPNAYVIEANILLDIGAASASMTTKATCIEASQGLIQDCLHGSEVPDEHMEKVLLRATQMGGRFTEADAAKLEREQGKGSGWYVLAESRPNVQPPERRAWLARAIAAAKPSIPAIRLLLHEELVGPSPNYLEAARLSDLAFHTLDEAGNKPRWHDHLQRVIALLGAARGNEVRPHAELVTKMMPKGVAQPWPYFLRASGENALLSGRIIERSSPRFMLIGSHTLAGLEAPIVCNPEKSRFKPTLARGDRVLFEVAAGVLGFTAWDVRLP